MPRRSARRASVDALELQVLAGVQAEQLAGELERRTVASRRLRIRLDRELTAAEIDAWTAVNRPRTPPAPLSISSTPPATAAATVVDEDLAHASRFDPYAGARAWGSR